MKISRRTMIAATAALAAAPLPSLAAGEDLLLPNFHVHQQQTPYTCGPASVRMVLQFLGHPLPEAQIAKKMRTSPHLGTATPMLLAACQSYLREFEPNLKARSVLGKKTCLERTIAGLERNLPAIASFLTENHFNPGHLVGHYCVVIGAAASRDQLTIANPFGYAQPIDTERFLRLCSWAPSPGDIPHVNTRGRTFIPLPPNFVVLEPK